jgi:hypothetical protein
MRAAGRGGGCSPAETPSTQIIGTAVTAMSGGSVINSRIRVQAGVPPQADSIRARARVIRDERACKAAGATAQKWRTSDTYQVVQIGGTYWVRGSSWKYTNALNDRYERIMSFVDSN